MRTRQLGGLLDFVKIGASAGAQIAAAKIAKPKTPKLPAAVPATAAAPATSTSGLSGFFADVPTWGWVAIGLGGAALLIGLTRR